MIVAQTQHAVSTGRRASFLDVLLRFERGEPVPGHELLRLPGFEPVEEIDPLESYQLSDNGPTLQVFIHAALLAAEVDCDAEPGEWLADTVTFHETLLEMRAAGEQPRDCFRHFAWQLGMLADFGAGMRKLQTN